MPLCSGLCVPVDSTIPRRWAHRHFPHPTRPGADTGSIPTPSSPHLAPERRHTSDDTKTHRAAPGAVRPPAARSRPLRRHAPAAPQPCRRAHRPGEHLAHHHFKARGPPPFDSLPPRPGLASALTGTESEIFYPKFMVPSLSKPRRSHYKHQPAGQSPPKVGTFLSRFCKLYSPGCSRAESGPATLPRVAKSV